MPNPILEFDRIRPLHGRRDKAFEELCCQLADLDPAPPGSVFHRTGEGADGGVEGYRTHPDGSETGWQAKYVFEMGDVQIRQLDRSLARVLQTHPALTVFVVCLPFDLRDGRRPNVLTERQRYERWCQDREAAARADDRALEIRLWDRHALVDLLTREAADYRGKRLYWFDDTVLTPAWFEARMAGPLADLHERYQPENHVDVEVSDALRGVIRDPALLAEPAAWGARLGRILGTLGRLGDPPGLDPAQMRRLEAEAGALVTGLLAPIDVWRRPLPTGAWSDGVEASLAALSPLVARIWAREVDPVLEPWKQPLYEVRAALEAVDEALADGPWSLINADRLLLEGEAGSGKSHVLADLARHRLAAGYPTLLALGGGLAIGDPWRGLLDGWDLSGETVDDVLAALDAAAEAAGGPALIVIDGINEGEGPRLWRGRLAGFLEAVARRPRIVMILSCRTAYLHAVGLGAPIPGLARLDHPGFETTDAAVRYLDKRGVHGPGRPDLGPELSNPLFLKTCCDLLDRRGETAFPRGLSGVTAVFRFYTDAVAATLEARMELDPLQDIPRRAIRAFAEALGAAPGGRLPVDRAIAVFDSVLPSNGRRDASLLHQFVSEGVLSTEIDYGAGETSVVRFTFERFSDHMIAERLLRDLSATEAQAAFSTGPLGRRLLQAQGEDWSGVLETLAIQLPERYGLELPDVAPDGADLFVLERAFRASLLWRDPAAFTPRTLELVGSDQEQLALLLQVATEPANPFNADYLQTRLVAMTMPDRDALWSVGVAAEGLRRGGARALIAWGLGAGRGADTARIRLGAIALSWLFSTSHRAVRDRATKALAALLTNRLDLAADLVEESLALDDLYVPERVLAAAYGAAMATTDPEAIRLLAMRVWCAVFAAGSPPAHLLLRDFAAGVLEYAAARRILPDEVDLARVHGPFDGVWPLEPVSEKDLKPFDRRSAGGRYWGEILSSCSDHGDFGRYVIAYRFHHWSRRPVADAGLDLEGLWDRFVEGLETLPGPAADAFVGYFGAEVLAARAIPASWNPSAEEKTRAEAANGVARTARIAFEAHLEPTELEDWRTGPALYSRSGFDGDRAAFDLLEIEPVRRWITKRAYDLGWTPERFEAFERSGVITHDRMTHTVERIGKKYQWLALHEAMARAADNLAPLSTSRDGPLGRYDGAWSTGLRDLDPSLLAAGMAEDRDEAWWTPIAPRLQARPAGEAMAWLDSGHDLVSDGRMLEVRSPDGVDHVVLHSFVRVRGADEDYGDAAAEPETWGRVDALVVRREDKDRLLTALGGQHWTGSHDLPAYESELEAFLGELAWRQPYTGWMDWMAGPRGRDRHVRTSHATEPPEIRRPAFEYAAERLTYDVSLDQDVRAQAPAPWLMTALGLTLTDPRGFVFSNAEGRPVFFDPALTQPGPSAALVEKAAFDAMLEREGLDIVWVVVGEKNVYGADHEGFGGRRVHTTVFDRHDGTVRATRHLTRVEPSEEQLADLYGEEAPDDD